MRSRGREVLTRALVTVLTCAVLGAPLVGIAHAVDHHGAAESVDCGTCQWSKNVTGTVVEVPALSFVAITEVAPVTVVTEPDLRLRVSELHTRGPPSTRV